MYPLKQGVDCVVDTLSLKNQLLFFIFRLSWQNGIGLKTMHKNFFDRVYIYYNNMNKKK